MRRLSDRLTLPPSRVVKRAQLARLHFPHRCDVWRPAPSVPGPDLQRPDEVFEIAYRDQVCRYHVTTEVTDPTPIGQMDIPNLFTLDKFLFPEGVTVADKWVVVFRSAGPNLGQVFTIQGDPQMTNDEPLWHFAHSLVYCARTPLAPPGVDLPEPGQQNAAAEPRWSPGRAPSA